MILSVLLSFFVFNSNLTQNLNEVRLVKGIVISEKEALPGVNIVVLGTTIGTTTDLDGRFCLLIPQDRTVFLQNTQCFSNLIIKVDLVTNFVKIELTGSKRKMKLAGQKSKESYEEWVAIEEELTPALNEFYSKLDSRKPCN